ncbi:hypothetical protein Lepto7375DRAFT_1782 [Leptolyngbya sp. PCC 7375]|nr:hypothetical protein Lepto7375DRAFT_1782 [Leptolyngbya sp. PCC 7375]
MKKVVQVTLMLSVLGLAAPAIADLPGRQNSQDNQTTTTTGQDDVVTTRTETPEEVRIRTTNNEATLDCEAKKDDQGQVILPFECDLSE